MTEISHLYEDESGNEFWWNQCAVDGCEYLACRSADSPKCHVHTFTGWHHKLIRFLRRMFTAIATLCLLTFAPHPSSALTIGDVCKGYGYTPGTDGFAGCVMHMHERNEAAQQEESARQAQFWQRMGQSSSSSFIGAVNDASGNASAQQPQQRNCLIGVRDIDPNCRYH